MIQRSLHFSSKHRQKVGINRAHDFTIKFNPVLKLSNDMKHEMAVNKILMIYSWHNIMPENENKTIKYSVDGGTNCETITFLMVCTRIPTLMILFMSIKKLSF